MSHLSRFRVSVWDVNAFGELSALSAVRFMQQAAGDHTAALGFDIEWYERQGAVWLIRDTTIEMLAPAFYRDDIEIRTWVSDIRRVRSQRQYEFRRLGDSRIVARGVSDWVYTDLARGRPMQPPLELQRALMPEGIVVRPRDPMKFDAPDSAAPAVRRVEFCDLDTVGHVNNSVYVTYVEQNLFDVLAAAGWRVDPLSAAAHLRVRRHRLEYHQSAEYGDNVAARVWVTAVGAAGFSARQILQRGELRLLSAETDWEWTGAALPEGLRAALRELSR